jgi:hypothetical protein
MISRGTIGSVGCKLTSGNPAQESPLGHGPQARPRQEIKRQNGGSGRGYLAVGGPLSSPGMAYWMVACSVYLYIAILGANVRICRVECVRHKLRQDCSGWAGLIEGK